MNPISKNTFISILIMLFFLPGQGSPSDNSDSILGTWLTAGGQSKVEIYKKNNKYYGRIVWLSRPTYNDGTPLQDRGNPDPKLRTRPVIGLNLLRDFEYDGGNEWDEGRIYDPESGKEYSCIITLKGQNTLEVRGYIGFSLFGRTTIWTR